MSKRNATEIEEETLPPAKKPAFAPSHLRIRLSQAYKTILPDQILIYISNVEWIRDHSVQNCYLYKLCSLILDCTPDGLQLFRTQSGVDCDDDDDPGWCIVEDHQAEFGGGTYLCKPLDRILLPCRGCANFCSTDCILCRKAPRVISPNLPCPCIGPRNTIDLPCRTLPSSLTHNPRSHRYDTCVIVARQDYIDSYV
jgi:hypothetical protein